MGGKLSQAKEAGLEGQRKTPAHTTVNRFLSWGLPTPCARFVWRKPGEFPVTAFLLGAGTGGLLAVDETSQLLQPILLCYELKALRFGCPSGGTFQLHSFLLRTSLEPPAHPSLAHILLTPINLYEEQKIMLMYSMVGLGALGWGTSPYIRCASLLLIPKMLGKEGRLLVLGYVLAAIYEGPVANLRHNLDEVVSSLGCTVELQINHTRMAWRVSTSPLRTVFNDLLKRKEELKFDIQNISQSFKELDAQVKSTSGYEPEASRELKGQGPEVRTRLKGVKAISTQKIYEAKTKLRCRYIVNAAIQSCHRWFDQKHARCMQTIKVPLFSHLLCLPMMFKFLCSIAKEREADSPAGHQREQGPAERGSEGLRRLSGGPAGRSLGAASDPAFLHVPVGFPGGRRSLLPLRKAEKATVIFPFKPTIQATEMKNVIRELLESLPVLMLLLILCVLDWAFFTIFDTISKHSFLQYTFSSSHHLEVNVGGDSMLARLLRKTIGALNTSSDLLIESSNMACLPKPMGMNSQDYTKAFLPAGLLVLLCLTQAFSYRLRRVIAAFYFPKREKKRVLFFYNELLRKRLVFTKFRRTVIRQRAQKQGRPRHRLADWCYRHCRFLWHFLRRRCVVCQAPETSESWVCPTPGCGAVYCASCWIDMGKKCPACTPRDELSSSAYSNSSDDATYAE
uniref:DC-STAMP domain-containing protein 1 isoform X6 n=1 Tax=Phascolarctos cinereus TaxID=38626 RepID=A0A6P5KPD3_PHACI|nr:DC-STAMP domain-containing protein 1 isoform X6 [Phascolarctos cinereus]